MSRFDSMFKAKGKGPVVADPPADNHPPALPAEPEKKKPGRPKGVAKKDNPGFVQCTAYVPAETHAAVKVALIQDAVREGRKPREFSDLVAERLAAWLESRPSE